MAKAAITARTMLDLVRELAAQKDISIRTVRRDIAAGKLRVQRDGAGLVYVPADTFVAYRASPSAAGDLLTVHEAAALLRVTEHSVRHGIYENRYASTLVGGRRFVLANEPSPGLRVLVDSEHGTVVLGDARQIRLSREETRFVDHSLSVREWLEHRRATESFIAKAHTRVASMVARRILKLLIDQPVFRVPDLAALRGITLRAAYHDAKKGALVVERIGNSKWLGVRLADARDYLGAATSTQRLLPDLARCAVAWWARPRDRAEARRIIAHVDRGLRGAFGAIACDKS